MGVRETVRRFARAALIISMALVTVLATSGQSAYGLGQGDGMLIYGEGTTTTPQTRTWNKSAGSWTAASSGPAAAATIRHSTERSSPVRNEIIAGYQTTGGTLYIQRWNGFNWTSEWSVAVGNSNIPRFDIAYEQSSGEAVVVYSTNTAPAGELAYRVWNGSAWTSATNLDAQRTTGVVDGVKLASRPGSNDLALAWGDLNFDLSANYWNGTTNVWQTEPSTVLSTGLSKVGTATSLTTRSFDLSFESVSGKLVVAWGNDGTQDLKYATRAAGSAGAWSAVNTNTTFPEEPTDMELASEPGTNYIAYANMTDNGNDADAGIWNGSAWGSINNFDTSTDTVGAGTSGLSVEWLIKGAQSRAVVSYDDNQAAGVDWLYFNKNTSTWTNGTDYTGAPAPANTDDRLHRFRSNPFDTSEASLLVIDGGGSLYVKQLKFDGTNLVWSSTEGAAALSGTISMASGFAADFAYSKYVPTGTLGVNIVDAAGANVAAPSAAMSSAALSFDCQTSSGTLGSSSQRIRVSNGTGSPAWTASVAATGGSSAQWSSGTRSYDFNDPAGSPAGCTAGSDGDTVAGRLTVNPGAATVTPQTGCTAAGVSLGGASGFSENAADSVTLMSASSTAMYDCYWDMTGISLSQTIPAQQDNGAYTLNMTVTVVAN